MSFLRFTIVTPSLNRPDYLDETIRSVVTQRGPFDIEYIVQDGGSDDRVIRILDEWKRRIQSGSFIPRCNSLSFAYHVERDSGMYDAINRGFEKGTGELMAWINSDDVYFPGCFDTVRLIMQNYAVVDWVIGRTACINESGAVTFTDRHQKAVSREYVKKGYYRTDLPFFNWLPQDSIMWRKRLWKEAGPLETSNRLVSDFQLWQSFARIADPVRVESLIGAFRYHGQQLTADTNAYREELGSPPQLPLGLKVACGFKWLIPQLGRLTNRLPGKYLPLRILGLRKSDILGLSCNWDFKESRWKLSQRSSI